MRVMPQSFFVFKKVLPFLPQQKLLPTPEMLAADLHISPFFDLIQQFRAGF